MPSLKQETMNTIAAAVAVKDDDPRMQGMLLHYKDEFILLNGNE